MSYRRACSLDELTPDTPHGVRLGETPVCLVRTAERVYALHDECTHGRVPLSAGDVDAEEASLFCLAHGASFDLATGAVLCPPATRPVATYPVTIDGEDVLVDLDNPIQEQ